MTTSASRGFDAPGTVSTITVRVKFMSADNSTTVYYGAFASSGSNVSQYVEAQEFMA